MAVTGDAMETIKAMIVSGELKPGERLPPEHELSERLGLSRNSLREAVKSLEVVRILDVRRGDGTYVTSLEPRLLLEAMSFVVDLHQDSSVIEMFEVRKVLEPHIAGVAAIRITDEELAGIRGSLDSIGEGPTVEDLVAHDLDFHRRIVAAGGNAYLTSLLDGLSGATVRARVWRGLTEEGSVERTLDEHEAIFAALNDHDADRARAWTTIHVGGIESWLRAALDA
jgi:GntR family transcriptional repressor for pyruvate dehydrogenase complex